MKVLIKLIVLILIINFLLFAVNSFSQNGISVNTSGASADNSTILDISSTSQGLLIPRMKITDRNEIASPAQSLLIFNTTTNCFEAFVNGSWYSISCPSICPQMQKTYGGLTHDIPCSVQYTIDGGYIIGGVTTSFGAGEGDFYLLKTDGNGNVIWSSTFGGTGLEGAVALNNTSDGGYVMAGVTNTWGAGSGDFYVVKTDASGNLSWSKAYGGYAMDHAYSVIQSSDGGYVIAGLTESFGAGGQKAYLVKTDGSGNLLWNRTFGGTGQSPEIFNSVKQTTDGGYIMAGFTENFGAGGTDIFVVKTDGSGNLSWCKTYGGTEGEMGRSVQQTSDGGYIITGTTYSFGTAGGDLYIVKTDGIGNLSWSKTFGGAGIEDQASVQQTNDGGYILAGNTNGFGAGQDDCYLVKTDVIGNLSWSRTFGGKLIDDAVSVQQTSDGGYILAGYTTSFGAGVWDFYLVKTDNNGNAGGCNTFTPATIVRSPTTIVTIAFPEVTNPSPKVTNPATVVTHPTPTVATPCSLCK
jgi:hypothetical protein